MISIVTTNPEKGYKEVFAPNLYIERKNRNVFFLGQASVLGTNAPYVFQNTDNSKKGAVDLVNFMLNFSLNEVEIWDLQEEKPPNYLFIAYNSDTSFYMNKADSVEQIPIEGEGEKVFYTNDTTDLGMVALLTEFLNWFQK